MLSDRELVDAVLGGDQEAATLLYRAYFSSVRAVVRKFQHIVSVDDVVQEAFIKIFEKLGTWRGEAQLKTWIYRVAFTTAMIHIRVAGQLLAKSTIEMDNPNIKIPEPSMTPNYLPKFDLDHVMQVIKTLPPRKRQVAYLLVQGRSIAEIQAATGITQGAVKGEISRTRSRLRQLAIGGLSCSL